MFPIISIIVRLDKGKIDKIEVEDLKNACANPMSPEKVAADFKNKSAEPFSLCPIDYCTTNEKGECDIKLFVSWQGTDSTGKNLISSGERFMNFENYNLVGMYDSIMLISNRGSNETPYDPSVISKEVLDRVAKPPQAAVQSV